MYLTKINVGHIDAAGNGLHGYGWHAGLWRAFDKDERQRPFLFRVDLSRTEHRVLMLSKVPPAPPPWGVWQTKDVPQGFLDHRVYYFQLRSNPVRRHENTARPLMEPNEIEAWITEHLEKAGLKLLGLNFSPPRAQKIKRKGSGQPAIFLNSVDAAGVVEVIDRAAFQNKWPNGIGRGKAFGYGLMLLKPIAN